VGVVFASKGVMGSYVEESVLGGSLTSESSERCVGRCVVGEYGFKLPRLRVFRGIGVVLIASQLALRGRDGRWWEGKGG
jgi:hypothetical protein